MNDSAISKAIANTHFVLASIIFFCLGVIVLIYLSLSGGLHIDRIKLGPVDARQLYIKWDNALFLSIDTLSLRSAPAKQETSAPLTQTLALLMRHLDDAWIGALQIGHFHSDMLNASVYFDPDNTSALSLQSPWALAQITITPLAEAPHRYQVDMHGTSHRFDADFTATGILDSDTVDLHLGGDINVSKDIKLAFNVQAHKTMASLSMMSRTPFASVAPLVRPLHLHPITERWIVDRGSGGPIMLHQLRTTIPYDNPEETLGNLYAHVTFENIQYRFANDPGAFEPVSAKQAEIIFEHRKLSIVPIESRFYDHEGGSTWLAIDFTTSQPFLTLHLNLQTALDEPIHRLIASYGIHLPFVQTKGSIDTALTLNIDLDTGRTGARGHFKIAKGQLDFSGMPIDLNASSFSLHDSDINIHTLNIALLDNNVTATVTGQLDPAKKEGTLDFKVNRARFGTPESNIALLPAARPVDFTYTATPVQDYLRFMPTGWRLGAHRIRVADFSAPFTFSSLRLAVPPTALSYDNNLDVNLSGLVELGKLRAELDARLQHLRFGTFHNASPGTRMHILVDNNLTIETNTTTRWKMGENNISIGPLRLYSARGNTLSFTPTRLELSPLLAGTLTGKIDSQTLSSELSVSNFHFSDPTLARLFKIRKAFEVYVVPIKSKLDIVIPEYNMLFSARNEGWKLHFYSLQYFNESSPLLRDYNLTDSTLSVQTPDGEYPVEFNGTIDYPYAIAVEQGKSISHYRFKGSIDSDESVFFTINDAIHVSVDDERLRLFSNHVAYNFSELQRFYHDHATTKETNQTNKSARNTAAKPSPSTLPLYLDANDTAIIFPEERVALADTFSLQNFGKHTTVQLVKSKGSALLEVNGDAFYLYGQDLDDDFMEHFFNLSKFKGGALEFYVIGDSDDFKGLVKINDTTIYDYVLLNNLFAFINTVPALVTFSLPSYATKGITVSSAYMDLKYKKGLLDISGIKVDSKEMDFSGQGRINYNDDTMKLVLAVKTQAGKNVRKIPVVGYILSGDNNSVLTTVNVTGSIHDPKISSTLAEDIAVAPFTILKRALDFPLYYLKKLEEVDNNNPRRKAKNPHQITSGFESQH